MTIAKIGQSLEAFGWMNPLIADGESTIIAGHGCWLAARKLGLVEVPVVRVHHLIDDAIKFRHPPPSTPPIFRTGSRA